MYIFYDENCYATSVSTSPTYALIILLQNDGLSQMVATITYICMYLA